MSWTQERIEKLTTLWAEGYSATKIARAIGHVSRSGVLGKVHRLGLPSRATKLRVNSIAVGDIPCAPPIQTATRPARMISHPWRGHCRPKPDLRVITNPRPPEPSCRSIWEPEPGVKPVPLAELNDDMCRWPFGDPRQDGFGYCGAQQMPGRSFCADHAQLAIRKAGPRRT